MHPQYKLVVQVMILVHLSLQMFYLPMALAIPPPAFLVHKQFNLLYQFWIHTEVGRKRGEGVCVCMRMRVVVRGGEVSKE